MNRTEVRIAVATALAATAIASVTAGALFLDNHRAANATRTVPASAKITQTPSPAPTLPFGFNPGDCPTEDSCLMDYYNGGWHISKVPAPDTYPPECHRIPESLWDDCAVLYATAPDAPGEPAGPAKVRECIAGYPSFTELRSCFNQPVPAR